ncbi:MAG: choice-of-anchor D domain-containing protein, partial [Planctomycetaceae bacterium]
PVSRQIRIRNEGTSPLSLSGLAISGSSAFSLSAGLGRGTLAVGESTTFTVRYSPTTAGAQTANVVFTTDDANEARYTINLTGTGQGTVGDQYESDDAAANARTIT